MGEAQSTLFRVEFNGSVEVEARPERLSADAGALVLREVYSGLGLDEFFGEKLEDPRRGALVTHPQSELLRTQLLLLAQGFQDQRDVDALRDDPVLRLSVSDRRGQSPVQGPAAAGTPSGLPSQPTLSRFHATLSTQRGALRDGLLEIAARRLRAENRGRRKRYVTLDIDSVPIEVFGQQEGSAYNGYYGYSCFHPLVGSLGEQGDLLDLRLRPGNVHTADGAEEFVLSLIDRVEGKLCQVSSVRMDAGFPAEKLLAALEGRHVAYVARLRTNSRLEELARPHLEASSTEPPKEGQRLSFFELSYKAKSWSRPRRVVLIDKHVAGELLPQHFFLVTNWSSEQIPPEVLLAIYRRRGLAEGRLGELKSVLEPALSSAARPKSHYRGRKLEAGSRTSIDSVAVNETRLLLNALAYNLLHAVRVTMERATRTGWSLDRLRRLVLRVPARVLLHSRRILVVIPRRAARWWSALRRTLPAAYAFAAG